MNDLLRRTWVEINLDNVRHNYNLIRSCVAENVKMMCVIKANAYGHGAVQLAQVYDSLGCEWFAVSNLEEAMQIRNAGLKQNILILGYTNPESAKLLYDNNITQAAYSYEFAKRLNEKAEQLGVKIDVHIKIDTGMTRIGFWAHEQQDIEPACNEVLKLKDFENLEIKGIFTHFAVADEDNGEQFTRHQYSIFSSVADRLIQNGIQLELRHCCNSAATMLYPEMHMDMVRPGIILYGLSPSPELDGRWDFKPVMSLKTTVSLVKDVPEDVTISYGRTYKTEKMTKVATAAIGYADGYPRVVSNKADMLLNGKRVNIIGRVCMDQLMLDVSDVENAKQGDTVTVFGCDGDEYLSLDELAKLAGTINYELACDVSQRVARIYYENGKEIGYCSLLEKSFS